MQAVTDVMAKGMIAQGELVAKLEEETSRFLGAGASVSAGSGTAALGFALQGLNIGPGAEVILPTYVCKSVLDAVCSVGAAPVLCDVSADWVMTPDTVRPRITPNTRAIIVVHIFGIAADTPSFREFGVPIIEDSCQAFGGTIGARRVGMLGDVGVFSFHATKCLTTGEGGLVVSHDRELLHRIRTLRDGDPTQLSKRFPTGLSDLQAALGLSQLRRYPQFLQRRRELANVYFAHLNGDGVQLPLALGDRSIFFRFPVRTHRSFDDEHTAFAREGIHVRRGVDQLLHRLLGLKDHDFPNATRLYDETISIPLYPSLSRKEVDRLISACHCVWQVPQCEYASNS